MTKPPSARILHAGEPHQDVSGLLNKLRAAVLGANDGIVSVSGLVMGMAGATSDSRALLLAGVAGLVSGALSMAVGEYVSVSSQRDAEQAMISKEERELAEMPEEELAELEGMLVERGLSQETAEAAAAELHAGDPLRAHAEIELGIDIDELISPTQAAVSSMIAFALGASLPVLTITLFSPELRVAATSLSVVVALVLTGMVSAKISGSAPLRPVARNVIGGSLAMAITYGIGSIVGVAV